MYLLDLSLSTLSTAVALSLTRLLGAGTPAFVIIATNDSKVTSKSDMCPICPHHDCVHIRPFSAISHIFGPTCTISAPPVHAGGMDQWTVYGMLLVHIGDQDSHAT